jgi:ferredoxin-NADP reductase
VQRLRWRVARLVDSRAETASARTLVLQVDGWPGHLAGQHVDVRLTAEDGYSTQRSYSIAAPTEGDRIELTVQLVPDGEVSPFLVRDYAIGDPIEVRGPVGGWFVWQPEQPEPVLLVGGGSGIVPLMAMVRSRQATGRRVPFRLLYSVRTPQDLYYADELRRRDRDDAGLDVTVLYTRAAPDDWPRQPKRLNLADLSAARWPANVRPRCYVCGPTGFVETVAAMLVALGHDEHEVRTERFGPSGG